MKIAVFLQGTIIMHKNALEQPREIRVRQVIEGEESVRDYANYIPVGDVVQKLWEWESQGAELVYISSRKSISDVEKDKSVLKKYNFPSGEVVFRQTGEEYLEKI